MTDAPTERRLTVSVVIPAYFEEKTIGSIVERCLPFVDEVLVVNDGSTDDTVKVALAAGASGETCRECGRAGGYTGWIE